MINDENFIDLIEKTLKERRVKAVERKKLLEVLLKEPACTRDNLLDKEEQKTRDFKYNNSLKKEVKSEFKEQCDFVAWFKETYNGIVIMSIRNGGTRTAKEKVDQIREGLHAGAADLYIPEWHLWIEFKKTKGGVLSDKQIKFRDYVTHKCGDGWILANGFEDGKKKIINITKNIRVNNES